LLSLAVLLPLFCVILFERITLLIRLFLIIPRPPRSTLFPYTPLFRSLNEYYKSLKRAGFSEKHIFWLISDRESFPDWIIPNLPNRIDNIPYEDDDED